MLFFEKKKQQTFVSSQRRRCGGVVADHSFLKKRTKKLFVFFVGPAGRAALIMIPRTVLRWPRRVARCNPPVMAALRSAWRVVSLRS
jgi:hypothetical protein